MEDLGEAVITSSESSSESTICDGESDSKLHIDKTDGAKRLLQLDGATSLFTTSDKL